MANFRIGENGLDISSFDLPLGRTVRLLQWGGDGTGHTLELALNQSTSAVELKVLPDKLPALSTAFTLRGTAENARVTVGAFVRGTGQAQKYSGDLAVRVCGVPRKHTGYDVDLLSDLASKGDARYIHLYTQILGGPSDSTHVLSQNTTAGKYNCGDVAAGYGQKLFGKATSTVYYRYYDANSTASGVMDDLTFDAKMIRNGVGKIKSLLNQGISVRLWAIHHDGFAKVIQGDTRTHYLTVIGYKNDRFLCIDPWPAGSKMFYDGGMYARTLNAFLGELEFDLNNPTRGIRSVTPRMGVHDYRIIAGP